MKLKYAVLSLVILIMTCSCSTYRLSGKDDHYAYIPVRFFPYGDKPMMKVDVDGSRYLMLIDSGSGSCVDFQQHALNTMQNEQTGQEYCFSDIKGNEYNDPMFKIPKMKAGNLTVEIHVTELNEEYLNKGCKIWADDLYNPRMIDKIAKKIHREDGRIGTGIFKNFVCFLDFPRSSLILAEDMPTLIDSARCSLEGFVSLPFELNGSGPIIEVKTDLGMKKVLLDTGAFRSVFKHSQIAPDQINEFSPGKFIYNNKLLEIAGQDYGNIEFVLYEFSNKFEVDGILGIDFFNEHAICLDFPNKTIYIQPPGVQPNVFERLYYWFLGVWRT